MADVGFGLKAAARRFGLEFIPIATERYFLLCHDSIAQLPHYQRQLELVRSPSFTRAVNGLPGYLVSQAGQALSLPQAFPDFAFKSSH